jgi:hypothetical protein
MWMISSKTQPLTPSVIVCKIVMASILGCCCRCRLKPKEREDRPDRGTRRSGGRDLVLNVQSGDRKGDGRADRDGQRGSDKHFCTHILGFRRSKAPDVAQSSNDRQRQDLIEQTDRGNEKHSHQDDGYKNFCSCAHIQERGFQLRSCDAETC